MKDYKKEGEIKDSLIIEGNLILTGDLSVETRITVTGYIDCAGYSIEAGDWIEAGGSIEAGSSIEAKLGITAFLHITCEGTLNAGLRIVAGVCNWREIHDSDRTVTCGELVSGEVVGILVETGIEKQDSATSEAIALLKKNGYEIIKKEV